MSKPTTAPPQKPAPALPEGRFYRFVRGKGEFHAFMGVEVLEVKNGAGATREAVFPTTVDIAEGRLLAAMFEDVKVK